MSQLTERNGRDLATPLSWRVISAVATTAVVFVFTRRWELSLLVGGVEFVLKLPLLWLYERFWDGVPVGRREARPAVVWFTGLSGSGKSTISERVTAALRERGYKVEHLDGDSVRGIFPNTGFSRPERDAHVRRVGFLASKLEANGVFVVASFVSPYRDSREFVRALCRNFVEVHVSTPLAVCEARDVKGLYAKARRGEIASFTGVSDPYEAPPDAELVIDTTDVPVDAAVERVLAEVQRRSA